MSSNDHKIEMIDFLMTAEKLNRKMLTLSNKNTDLLKEVYGE